MQGRIWIALGLLAVAVSPAMAKDKTTIVGDLSGWIGTWTGGPEQEITITQGANGGLAVEGYATYGAEDPESAAMGAINVGGFAGNIPADWIEDNNVTIASTGDEIIPTSEAGQYDCWVDMTLKGEVLEVDDNGQCGGLNVSFIGTYTRQ